MTNEKLCFVIAPIGDPDSETRKRSDQVLKYVIRPAVTSCGYKALRADEIDKPGIITSQVIQHVVNDPLVVADLTDRNPNVFYELAIRHALRKPLVQLIKKGEAIPFDVAGTRTIYIDHRDLESVEAAKNEIIEQVKALEKDASDMETPISVSLDLQLLRQSEKPEERSLADLVAAVSDLRSSLSKVEAKIGTQDEQGVLDEIQAELQSLPRRIDEHSNMLRLPLFSRKGRFHPFMLREMIHMAPERSPGLGILIVASLFRDWVPWIYEVGLETYNLVKEGDKKKALKALDDFRRLVDFTIHGPWMREFGRSKEVYMLMEETEPLLDSVMQMIEKQLSSPRRTGKVKEAAEE